MDLRLAGTAVATWLTALAVLHLGAAAGVLLALGAGAAVVVIAGWLVGRRRSDRLPGQAGRRLPGRVPGISPGVSRRAVVLGGAAIGVLLGVLFGAAATAAQVVTRDAPALAALIARRAPVIVELTVRDDPRPGRAEPGRPPLYVVPVALSRVQPADVALSRVQPADVAPIRLRVRALVLATDPGWRTVLPGQSVRAQGRLGRSRGGDLRAAVLSVSGAPESIGSVPWHQRAAGALRAGLQRACAPLPDGPGGLLPGLVVGDTSTLPDEVADSFRATGMTHLVAVSGANCAIVCGAVLLLARWARCGPRVAAGVALLSLVGFVVLARPSPSVLRAAVMGGLALLALASARQRMAMPALCAAVTVLVVVDPELAGDPGFALSVLATGGLLVFASRWRDGLRRRRVPAGVAEALAVPAAAQIACAPVVAGLSGTVSLIALPANLLAVPAVAPATLLGVVATLLSPLWPAAAGAVAWVAQWPAWWLVNVAEVGARVPAGSLPWLPGVTGGLLLAAVLMLLLLAGRYSVPRRLALVTAVAAMLGALPVRLFADGWPPPGWVMVACAVGQGDTVVLPVAPGVAVVVDGGPDPAAADRCLRTLGVTTIPLLVVTHFHADHIGGLAGVVRDRAVDTVLIPSLPEPAAARAEVARSAAARQAQLREAEVGWSFTAGDVVLAVLGPPHRITGTRSDANNNSIVVKAAVRGVTILLTGDAETEEQAAVLARHGAAALRVDVMKVAHHGSAFQDPGFLDATRPGVVMVSVGDGNPYGHPNGAVLDRLGRGGARIMRTDRDGDLAAVRTVSGLSVARSRGPPNG